jgi:hypothetical protein
VVAEDLDGNVAVSGLGELVGGVEVAGDEGGEGSGLFLAGPDGGGGGDLGGPGTRRWTVPVPTRSRGAGRAGTA